MKMSEEKFDLMCQLLEEYCGQPIEINYIIGGDEEESTRQISFPMEIIGENRKAIEGTRCWVDEGQPASTVMWEVDEKLLDNCSCCSDYGAKVVDYDPFGESEIGA